MLFLNQDKNMADLMRILYRNNDKWLKIHALSEELELSAKTIRVYLEQLEILFKRYVHFTRSDGRVKINIASHLGYLTIQRVFLHNALISRILYYTFFHPLINKAELALHLGASESTIFRNIRQFNKMLRHGRRFALSFSFTDLSFIGDEQEIQRFYVNFLIEAAPRVDYWFFHDYLSEADMDRLTEEVSKVFGHALNFPYFRYLKVSLAVSILRLKQGYGLHRTINDAKLLCTIEKLAGNTQTRQFLKRCFPHSSDSAAKLLTEILAFLSTEEFLFFIRFANLDCSILPGYKRHYAFFSEQLSGLQQRFGLKVTEPQRFYTRLFTSFKFKLANIDASDFFINRTDDFLDYVRLIHKDFYEALTASLRSYLEYFHPQLQHKTAELTYTLYTLWPDLLPQLLKRRGPYRALVLSAYDTQYAETLCDLLNFAFPDFIRCELYKGHSNLSMLEAADSYEIIISDFSPVHPCGKIVFSFEQLPTAYEVKQLLYKIIEEALAAYAMFCEQTQSNEFSRPKQEDWGS